MGAPRTAGPLTPLDPERKALILAAGPVTDRQRLRQRIEPYDLLVCADGGLDLAAAWGLIPDLIVGDMDSVKERFSDISTLTVPCEKDDTDLMLAVQTAVQRGCGQIDIVGAFGGRIDHFWGNVQVAFFAHRQGVQARLLSEDCELFFLENESRSLSFRGERYLSVFSFSSCCKGVCLQGLKYPLEDAVLTFDRPLGVSNEFAASVAQITVREGVLLVMRVWQ